MSEIAIYTAASGAVEVRHLRSVSFSASLFKCSGENTRRRISMRCMWNMKPFDIRTLEVIGGSLPRRALNLTIEWAIEHREELMEDWNLCQSKQHPKRIKPLE